MERGAPLTAIVSDVHGNRCALEAVLDDARGQGAVRLWCLGDILGYGPEPRACLDLLRRHAHVIIRGNHEQAVLDGPFGFNPLAAAAVHWTRRELACLPGQGSEIRAFLESLPERSDQADAVLVHGSPAQPLDEYLFQEDTLEHLPRNRDYSPKLARSFRLIDRPCFVGHTHVAGAIGPDLSWTAPSACGDAYDTRGERCIVNVGSVGQPRDGDQRAAYALFDGRTVTFRRVTYDVAQTARAIRDTQGLPDALAVRLEEGW